MHKTAAYAATSATAPLAPWSLERRAPRAGEGLIEPFPRPVPAPRTLAADIGVPYAANGLIGLIFAATGPIAVIGGGVTQRGQPAAE